MIKLSKLNLRPDTVLAVNMSWMSIPTLQPPLETNALMPPADNPKTEADKAYVVQYEQWLDEHSRNIEQCLWQYETAISKLRKSKRVSSFYYTFLHVCQFRRCLLNTMWNFQDFSVIQIF